MQALLASVLVIALFTGLQELWRQLGGSGGAEIQGRALLLVGAQLMAFAVAVFPWRGLVDSLVVAVIGRSVRPDGAEMAVGVFAALGRAAQVAGLNGALLALVMAIPDWGQPQRVAADAALCACALIYGNALRWLVALPLENAAFQRLEEPASGDDAVPRSTAH
jgi:hypothetical protein